MGLVDDDEGRKNNQIRHDLEFFCGTIGITLGDERIENESESRPSVPDFIKDSHQQEIYKLLLDPDLSDKQLRSLALMGFIPMSERLLNLSSEDEEGDKLGAGACGEVHHKTVSYSYGALSFAAFNDKKLQSIMEKYYSGGEDAYEQAKTKFNNELKAQSQEMLNQNYVKKTSINQENNPREIGSAEHEEAIHQILIAKLRQHPTGPLQDADLINMVGTAILQGEVWKLRSLAKDKVGIIQKFLFGEDKVYTDMFEDLYQFMQVLQYEENLEKACKKRLWQVRKYIKDSGKSKIEGFKSQIIKVLSNKFPNSAEIGPLKEEINTQRTSAGLIEITVDETDAHAVQKLALAALELDFNKESQARFDMARIEISDKAGEVIQGEKNEINAWLKNKNRGELKEDVNDSEFVYVYQEMQREKASMKEELTAAEMAYLKIQMQDAHFMAMSDEVTADINEVFTFMKSQLTPEQKILVEENLLKNPQTMILSQKELDNWTQRDKFHYIQSAFSLLSTDSARLVVPEQGGEEIGIAEMADGSICDVLKKSTEGLDKSETVFNDGAQCLELFLPLFKTQARIHKEGFIFPDNKPENILYKKAKDGSMKLMLADPGMATTDIKFWGGSINYITPEKYKIFDKDGVQSETLSIQQQADNYALLLTMLEMYIGDFCYKKNTYKNFLKTCVQNGMMHPLKDLNQSLEWTNKLKNMKEEPIEPIGAFFNEMLGDGKSDTDDGYTKPGYIRYSTQVIVQKLSQTIAEQCNYQAKEVKTLNQVKKSSFIKRFMKSNKNSSAFIDKDGAVSSVQDAFNNAFMLEAKILNTPDAKLARLEAYLGSVKFNSLTNGLSGYSEADFEKKIKLIGNMMLRARGSNKAACLSMLKDVTVDSIESMVVHLSSSSGANIEVIDKLTPLYAKSLCFQEAQRSLEKKEVKNQDAVFKCLSTTLKRVFSFPKRSIIRQMKKCDLKKNLRRKVYNEIKKIDINTKNIKAHMIAQELGFKASDKDYGQYVGHIEKDLQSYDLELQAAMGATTSTPFQRERDYADKREAIITALSPSQEPKA